MKAPSPSVALLARRARALLQHLPLAIQGDVRSIHRARVATRRLREALPVISAGVSGHGKVRRHARRLTRALGAVRELDVALQILEERAVAGEVPGSALDRARAVVRVEREVRRDLMLRRLARVRLEKLEKRIAGLVDAVREAPPETWRRALAARLTRRARRLEQAVARAGAIYVPERLHAVRIAAKKLRYVLEIAAETGADSARPLVMTLKRAQTMLGRLQDLQVVLRQVDATVAERGLEPAARAGLAGLARSLEEESRRVHARFMRTAPGLTEVGERVAREIVPATVAASRRRAARMKMRLVRGSKRPAPQGSRAAPHGGRPAPPATRLAPPMPRRA